MVFGLGALARIDTALAFGRWTVLAALVLGAMGWATARRRSQGGAFGAALIVWACAGWWAGEVRVGHVTPTAPVFADGAGVVEGWVARIDPGEDTQRYTLVVTHLTPAEPVSLATPRRIRVHAEPGAAQLGDDLRAAVRLRPPPGPAVPGAYDFARTAFFARLDAVGRISGDVSARPAPKDAPIAQRLAAWRGQMASRLSEAGGAGYGGVVAALVVGDRSGIPEGVTQRLRAAGLSHILAISGLHLALVAGGVYAGVWKGLAAVPRLAQAHDLRKPAALAGLLAAVAYLIASGASISTQRAFIMAAIAFLAILVSRRALTLHSVGVAALAVLALTPESAATPGFQMSFAAAAALVAAFQSARTRRGPAHSRRPVPQVARFFGGLSATSLIAGAATGPIAAWHFGRIAVYGLLANIAAMPVFSLLAMPFAVAAGALAPLGLHGPFAAVSGWALSVVDAIAGLTAGAPGALRPVASGPPLAFAAIWVGLLGAIALRRGRWRALVIGLVTAAACSQLTPPPDVWISPTGRVIAHGAHGLTEVGGDPRRDGYGADVFARRVGLLYAQSASVAPNADDCDVDGCRITLKGGRTLVVAHTFSAALDDCSRADAVLLAGRTPQRLAARCPPGRVLGPWDGPYGIAQSAWVTQTGWRTREAGAEARAWRPINRSDE